MINIAYGSEMEAYLPPAELVTGARPGCALTDLTYKPAFLFARTSILGRLIYTFDHEDLDRTFA